MVRRLLVALGLLMAAFVVPFPAGAVNPDEVLEDPALEARAREISKGLRCVVCQNQSIDDSDGNLAKDLRVLVRDRLVAGDSDEDVVDYVVSRYGDFVLLKPPFKMTTLALWLGPVIIVGLGVFGFFTVFRRRTAAGEAGPVTEPAPLSDEERAQLEALLEKDDG